MRFSAVLAAVSALVACVYASDVVTTDTANPIFAPIANSVVTAGQPYTIEWSPNAGKTVTLTLRKGLNPKALDTLEVIASMCPAARRRSSPS